MIDSTSSRAAQIRRDTWQRRHDRSRIGNGSYSLMASKPPAMLPETFVTRACDLICMEAIRDNAKISKLDTSTIKMVFTGKTPVTESWSITIGQPSPEGGARAATTPASISRRTARFDK
ncbi:hypothetical protein [Sphingopyxis sp. EG6]|uniref:hypothetical protein n=1 Tax=Sphingopyxis sp. EG6 TaxID=1874061 RepID=UPI000DC620F2|nr:hypothetical protein [Sphingopyxis sp. EG6]BBB08722.1 long-chain-fatty-acid-CoA ligase [Sphingopyxis sp. EG6]